MSTSALPSQWFETPDLSGDLVKLVQLRPHHAPGFLAAADDEVFAHLRQPVPTTLAQAQELVDWFIRQEQIQPWAQISQDTGEFAGITTFYDIDPEFRTVAIGHTWLAQKYWRTGLNTEAKLLLLTHAFERLGCVRVVWHTDNRNERSSQALHRLGATEEGILRKHKLRRDGSWRDTVLFSLLDDEWPAVKQQLVEALDKHRQ